MKYGLICFDLQGTLTNSEFSDYFWREMLPTLYQKSRGIKTLSEAKETLGAIFSQYGKYDFRYYSISYWIDELGLNMTEDELISSIASESTFFSDMEDIVKQLTRENKIIILSTTVRSFMTRELNGRENLFSQTYSSLDDFSVAGKTTGLYQKISSDYHVKPEESINIGDNWEMDITNAQGAGWDTFFFDKKLSRGKTITQLQVKLRDNLALESPLLSAPARK